MQCLNYHSKDISTGFSSLTTQPDGSGVSFLQELQDDQGQVTGSTKGSKDAQTLASGTLIGMLRMGDKLNKLVKIRNVKYAPDMEDNLIRVKDLENLGIHVDFGKNVLINRAAGREVVRFLKPRNDCHMSTHTCQNHKV